MNVKKILLPVLVFFIGTKLLSQTTHTVSLSATGTNTLNVTCSVGDILLFQSAAQPLAIKIFRNPTPNYTVTLTGTSSSYTVTATDTSYSSIVSLSPVSTTVGKINLTGTTGISALKNNTTILLYPNPVNGCLTITGNEINSVAAIKDASGKFLKRINLPFPSNQIDLADLSNGIYFVEIKNKMHKFLIAR